MGSPETAAPPATASWQDRDWSTYIHDIDVEGRRLRYVDMGEGAPLVLVHGTGGAWQSWLLNIEALARRHRVIAVDLPGFGQSDPLPAAPNMSAYAASIAALLDQLGLARVTILGHSLGGVAAMRFVLEHPERTASLILLDGGGMELKAVRLRLVVGSLVVFNALMGRPSVVRAMVRRPRLRRAMMAGFVRDPAIATAALAHEMMSVFASPGLVKALMSAARDDVAQHAERVTAPTLLLWGEKDPVVPVASARKLAATLPNARLTTFPGVGHCPMLEQAARFNELVADWVDEIAAVGR